MVLDLAFRFPWRKDHSEEVGVSASKVVVRRMRPGTKAHDLEQLLLRQWTSEHRAGRGHVHVGAFAVCMNMFADRTMLVRYVQGGGSAHNLVAGRVRLEATQSAPPKGHCNIYGWRLVAAYRVRPRTSESWTTCNRLRL